MVVDITSVTVLKNMYNILTGLGKKNLVIPIFKAGKKGSKLWDNILKKCVFTVGMGGRRN